MVGASPEAATPLARQGRRGVHGGVADCAAQCAGIADQRRKGPRNTDDRASDIECGRWWYQEKFKSEPGRLDRSGEGHESARLRAKNFGRIWQADRRPKTTGRGVRQV